jgi:hypothetical protein
MLNRFLHLPIRCLLSLGLALLMAVPNVVLSAQAQQPGASKLNLVIVEGEGAINNVRQRTAREPIVQVEDENHRPVAGASVLFILPENGPSGTFANGSRSLQVMTNSKGQAVAKGLRLNDVSGKFQIQVEASYKGTTATTTINQANAVLTAAASGSSVASTVSTILAVAATAVAVGVVLATNKDEGTRSPNVPTRGGNNR